MHKEACAVIAHKNLPEFKLPFSTKCHSHYRELQFKKLTGLKLFFSILLTSFHSFFNLTCPFGMLLSPYAKFPGLVLVPHQLGERISDFSKAGVGC